MQNSSQNKMAVQPIAPLMFRIGLPIVLSMILQAAYNVVDSAYLARMAAGGEEALTALSLAFPVQLFMVAVSIGTGVGTNALLAKLLGLGDRESANRTVGNAQTLAVILSAVFMLFSLLGARPSPPCAAAHIILRRKTSLRPHIIPQVHHSIKKIPTNTKTRLAAGFCV